MSNGGGPLLSGCSTGPVSIVYDATNENQVYLPVNIISYFICHLTVLLFVSFVIHNNKVAALVGFIAGKPGTEWRCKSVGAPAEIPNISIFP